MAMSASTYYSPSLFHLTTSTHPFKPLPPTSITFPKPPPISASTTTTTTTPITTTPSSTSTRLFNFAAGPATLPEKVLLKAQSEFLNWNNSAGMSVNEMSHRGKPFLSIIQKAESDLRSLLNIPDSYAVLFLQGGASSQFSAIPLNLCASKNDVVDHIVTGSWSDKAFKEAKKYCSPKVIWSGKSDNYTRIPAFGELEQSNNTNYLHFCANETIHGVEFKDEYPTPVNGVLVADMSSNFCSKPIDVSKFGLIYAGAQKNVGPSGVTIVIVRKDLVKKAQDITPVMFDYKTHIENNSLYNTPPCYNIYMCGLVFEDLLAQGGLVEVEKKNVKKAGILYEAIDKSGGFYRCPVEKSVRSLMNVPFTIAKPELEGVFIEEAKKEKMVELKGHRSVGGMRASIYNAMPLAGVEKLVAFMKDFQQKHG